MKNKKLLICLLMLLMVAFSFCFISCKKEKVIATINIAEENYRLNILGEMTLSVTTENTSGEIVWNSSNPNVATVENGVVIGKNVGTATITATVGDVTDTCIVEVIETNDAPIILLSQPTLSLGLDTEYTVTAQVFWRGEDVTDKVTLGWSLGAQSQDGVVSVQVLENNKAVFKGVSVGETEYYVSTTIGSEYVNGKISIRVNEVDLTFESQDGSVSFSANGKYTMKIATMDEEGNHLSVPFPKFTVYNAGEEVSDAAFVWESANESILKVEDGHLVALKAGEVDVYCTYNGHQIVVEVQVQRGTVYTDVSANFELVDLRPQAVEISVDGVVEGVYLNEVLVGEYNDGMLTLYEKVLPTTGRELGSKEIVVRTDQAEYFMTVNIYTMLIDTADELNAWHSVAFKNGDDGYFALASDINFNGAYTGSRSWENKENCYQWANPDTAGFRGVFDGGGHIISGLRIERQWASFITLLNAEGVIKNVGFVNAKLSNLGAYVCTWGCGTIENVYVQYASGAYGGSAYAGTFFTTDNARNMTGVLKIKDCYVDASMITSKGSTIANWIGMASFDSKAKGDSTYSYVDMQGVYVKKPANLDSIELVADANNADETYKGFISESVMAADEAVQAELATWDVDCWTIRDGIPVFNRIANALSVSTSSSWYYTIEGEIFTIKGEDYTFTVIPTKEGLDEFIVLVNGEKVASNDGVYKIKNVTEALRIEVLHGYIEIGEPVSVNYEGDTVKIQKAVYSHMGNGGYYAYLSENYIKYMLDEGYTKIMFTLACDGLIAVNARCYYTANDQVGGMVGTDGQQFIINLDEVVGNIYFVGMNASNSGNAIKDEADAWIQVSKIQYVK